MEKISRRLSRCLDIIGYRMDLIRCRRDMYSALDRQLNMKWKEYTQLTAGSKAEGIAKYYESDVDRLFIYKNVNCFENGISNSNSVVFHMDQVGCSPGYTRLILSNLSKGKLSSEVSNCLVFDNGHTYISNKFNESFVAFSEYGRNAHKLDVNGSHAEFVRNHGPCASFRSENLKYDFVAGFKCTSEKLLQKWKQRKRTCNWPDSKLVNEISTINGTVVPVANVNSRFPNTEWRICFTQAELFLVNSLDEHQIKVYLLLKQLSKAVLEPICPAVSSYIVKNVILWQAENTPKKYFAPNFLLLRTIEALKCLHDCFKSNLLRNYMIEDRNIFQGRISEGQRKQLIDKIDQLLNKDEEFIRESKKAFSEYEYFDTPTFIRKAEKEEQIEKLLLMQSLAYLKVYDRSYTREQFLHCLGEDKEYSELKAELYSLVVPERRNEPIHDINFLL
jgi:hypothetical protein